MAVEDIGLADPQAMTIALAAKDATTISDHPKGELALAEAASIARRRRNRNAVYVAFKAATAAAKSNGSLMPPKHILNSPTRFMREEGLREGYATITTT